MDFYFSFVFCLFLNFGLSLQSNFSQPCKENWTPYLDLKCLIVIDEFHDYDDATLTCRANDPSAILLTIHSAKENKFVTNYFFKTKQIKESIWIGARRFAHNNDQFQWSDNTNLNYVNWGPKSPKNTTNDACVQMIADKGARQGKWADKPCSIRSNLVACQMSQTWSIEKIQEKLLQTRDALEQERKQLTNLKVELQTLVEVERKRSMSAENALQTQINVIKSVPALPEGFIYVQLPRQQEPKILWPAFYWSDVTCQYAGYFFRAEGGGSEPFGYSQGDNAPRIAEIQVTTDRIERFKEHAYFYPGQWNDYIKTGDGYRASKDGFSMRLSGGEVRPKNMAIKIWKRV